MILRNFFIKFACPKGDKLQETDESKMVLKKRIIQELKNTRVANIDKMLQYMEQHGYYECSCSSHNNWRGGTSQHIWAVYLIAKAIRDKSKNEPQIARYATNQKLAIVCLLHDLCDMGVLIYMDGRRVGGHGNKSYSIMKTLNVGTEAEREAVRNHMHKDCQHNLTSQEEIDEYTILHSLVFQADHCASGTAWNSTRFKESRTQHKGVFTEDKSYLRAVAMDRSVQSGMFHCYVDEKSELREYRNYNRDSIKWNYCENGIHDLIDSSKRIQLGGNRDIISESHEYIKKTEERICIVVGVSLDIPQDKDTRLRRGWIDEQDILITSNILNSFYNNQECKEKKRRHRFKFTMRDDIKKHYQALPEKNGGIYLPGVTMIRDGSSRGFPFVEPWKVDLLLVPSRRRFPMFVIPSRLLKNR